MSQNTIEAQAKSLIYRHPLQRISSPSRGLSSLIHAAGLSSFAASFKYLVDWPNPVNDSYGWHFQYLTIIGLSLATITFVVGSLADLTLSPRLFLIKNALLIDKKLVMPDWVQLDPLADIGFHFVPAFALVIDLLFLSPPWTITVLPTMAVSGVLAFSYWLWVEHCYRQNGWYPYPLFEVLTPSWRAALFAGSAVVMTLSTATLKWLYGRVNRYDGAGQGPKARPGAVKG